MTASAAFSSAMIHSRSKSTHTVAYVRRQWVGRPGATDYGLATMKTSNPGLFIDRCREAGCRIVSVKILEKQ